MSDLIPRPNGEFTLFTNDKVFDLVYDASTRRKWVEVTVPFVPAKLALRGDGMLFAVDDQNNLWQRLSDRREHVGSQITVTAEWKQIARAPE